MTFIIIRADLIEQLFQMLSSTRVMCTPARELSPPFIPKYDKVMCNDGSFSCGAVHFVDTPSKLEFQVFTRHSILVNTKYAHAV